MRRTLSAAAALLAACGSTQPPEPALDEVAGGDSVTVRIAYGSTVRVDGIALTFEAVPEDSRCAVDVVCVWAGNGRVALMLRAGPAAEQVELNTTIEPHEIAFGDRTIRLDRLTPEPRSDRPIRRGDYRAVVTLLRR